MSNERQFLSEIYVDGEQVCVVRDVLGGHPPECGRCVYLRFCEETRSHEEIVDLFIEAERQSFRRDLTEHLEEQGYYD